MDGRVTTSSLPNAMRAVAERAIPTVREREETLATIAHPMTGRTVAPPDLGKAHQAFFAAKEYEALSRAVDELVLRAARWERLGVGWDEAQWLASRPDITWERLAGPDDGRLRKLGIPPRVIAALRGVVPVLERSH